MATIAAVSDDLAYAVDEVSALVAAGHTVTEFTVAEAEVAYALDTFDLIWCPIPTIAGESDEADLLRQQSTNGKPILLGLYVGGAGAANPASTVLDDMGLADTVRTQVPIGGYVPDEVKFDRVEIEDNTHTITTGLSLGDLFVQDSGEYDCQGGVYLTDDYVGTVLGTGGTDSYLDTYGTLIAVESATVSLTGLPFGNRVVLYGFNFHGNWPLNADGYALLVACAEWAIAGTATSITLTAPTISVEAIAGQTALIRIDEHFRDDWKIRVLLASDSSLVYTSATEDGYDFTHQITTAALDPLTEYEVSGARYRDGSWSAWGGEVEFTTLDNYAPSAPGEWITPEDEEALSETVLLFSDDATDADGDDLTYSTEFSEDGGDWEVLPDDDVSITHTLSFSVGTELDYRRRAYDGMEYGPYGDTISITVAVSADPVLEYVALVAPGTVVGHTGPYVGTSSHASTQYQVQLFGEGWTSPTDTGYVTGAYLLVSPEFSSLTEDPYEMRFRQRSDLGVDTAWSEAVEFIPSFDFESFDGSTPLSGFTNGSYYDLIECPGTYGGTCIIDTVAGSDKLAVWTDGGMSSGFRTRVMNHWNMEHQLAPWVPWGALGHTMTFYFAYDPVTGAGYRVTVNFAGQSVSISRCSGSGSTVPGGGGFSVSLPPDEWIEISASVETSYRRWHGLACSLSPPYNIEDIVVEFANQVNIVTVRVGSTTLSWTDYGWQALNSCIFANAIPTRGYSGFQFGNVGEGMRRLDYFGVGGSLVTFSPDDAVSGAVELVPEITRPRAGEVFDESMTLTLPNADTYQVSDDGGETWGSDEAYTASEIVDVSGWDNGYEYVIRAKQTTSEWAYSQKFSIDHRATPICYYHYFSDEEWVLPPEDMTKLWNSTENWQIAWQLESQANPGTALVHSATNSNASAIRVDSFPLARNGEIRALLRNYHDISGAGVFGRGSGSDATGEGYWASFVKSYFNRVYRKEAGSDVQIGNLDQFRHGAPMMGAMRIVEDTIAVKFWVADAREPDEWMTVVEDAEFDDEGYWGLARAGYFYANYPGCYESVSFVKLDDEDDIPEPIPGEADVAEKAWAFVLDGHTFYVLNRVDDYSLICDLTTGHWHMWYTDLPPAVSGGDQYWNMWRGIMWKGRVIACDIEDPIIWELDPHSFLDQESLIIPRAVTAFQPLRGSASVRQGSFRVTARREVLEHLSIVTMQFSDDAGRTWSHDYEVVMDTDDVSKRIEYRSLGRIRAPGRLWEITDAGGLVRIEGADSDLEGEED